MLFMMVSMAAEAVSGDDLNGTTTTMRSGKALFAQSGRKLRTPKYHDDRGLNARNGPYFETFEGGELNLISLVQRVDYGQIRRFCKILRGTA